MKNLRTVIGAAICWKSHANTWPGHDAAYINLLPKVESWAWAGHHFLFSVYQPIFLSAPFRSHHAIASRSVMV